MLPRLTVCLLLFTLLACSVDPPKPGEALTVKNPRRPNAAMWKKVDQPREFQARGRPSEYTNGRVVIWLDNGTQIRVSDYNAEHHSVFTTWSDPGDPAGEKFSGWLDAGELTPN